MWYVRYFTRLWDDRHDESHWVPVDWMEKLWAILVCQLEVPEKS